MIGFGFDTNILVRAASRRFLSALLERLGKPLYLVPEVRAELEGVLRRRVENAWVEKLEQEDPEETRWSVQDRARIVAAAADSVSGWAKETLGNQDAEAGLIAIHHDMQDSLAVANLLRGLRTVHFPGEHVQGYGSDRTIICQCMHHRLIPVVTANVRSISHDVINRWAAPWIRREMPRGNNLPARLIVEPEEAVAVLTDRDPDLIYQTAVGACLPSREVESYVMDGILRRTAEMMGRSGLSRSAATVLACYENDPNPEVTFSDVRQSLPARTRETEELRLSLERRYTSAAGYVGQV